MPGRVLIVDDSCDPASLTPRELEPYSDLVILCWLSPDSLEPLRERVVCHRLLDVVGGLERWERRAIALMEQVCDAGPSHHGLLWRSLLAEKLFQEALVAQAVLDAERLCQRLAGDGVVDYRISGDLERLFHGLTALGHEGSEPPGHEARPGLAARLTRRLRRVLLTGNLRGQVWVLLDQLDSTYRLRLSGNRLRRPGRRLETGGVTFFSSYVNNSRLLRVFEPYVDAPAHWLVTNHPARAGAGGHRGAIDWLWRFAAMPSRTEPDCPEPAHPERLRAWLATSPTWRHWRRRGQVALARLTACWERYLDEARPRLVVMANLWGLEGWLTRLAQRRGVPVLQVLHGVLGGEFYTGRPVPADALVVWGDFWRDLWPQEERRRIHVANPRGAFQRVDRPPASRRRLTYFSWPIDRSRFYNDADILDGFIDLFHRLLERGGCELVLRAHPLENLSDLVGRWRRRHGALPPGLEVSQHEPLAEILAATDVAVMFRSTVMLDCFASGIPVVIPGWIDFSWKDRLESLQGVHLAADFRQLEEVLRAWIAEPPDLDRDEVRPFLAPEDEAPEALRRLLDDLIDRRHARSD